MRRLSEINEGMFSGIIKRSNSNQVKKENIESFNEYELFDYINKNYEVKEDKDNVKITIWAGNILIPFIFIRNTQDINPSNISNMYILFERDYDTREKYLSEIGLPVIIKEKNIDLYNNIKNNYNIKDDSFWIKINHKKNDMNNYMVIDIIDTILDYIGDDTAIRKKRI